MIIQNIVNGFKGYPGVSVTNNRSFQSYFNLMNTQDKLLFNML